MNDIDEQRILHTLYNYGHFFSPEALAVTGTKESDLSLLTLQDRVVKEAVRSYQRWYKPDLDRLTMRDIPCGGRRRPAEIDGEVDTNTEIVLSLPRCGLPDYPDPTSTVEEASWPDNCRGKITTSYQMSVPGLTPTQVENLWQEADNHWAKVLDVGFELKLASYPNTMIFTFLANLSGNTLADQYLATGSCNFRSQGRVDSRQWSDVLFVTTITHEHGHALGINHLSDANATMYPSITQASMGRRGAPNSSDIQASLQLGYRRRTEPPPPPPNGHRLTVESDTPIRVLPTNT